MNNRYNELPLSLQKQVDTLINGIASSIAPKYESSGQFIDDSGENESLKSRLLEQERKVRELAYYKGIPHKADTPER